MSGSKDELEDLETAYVEFKGDMTEILNNVMCSTIEDEPRFAKIINGWIKKKTVPDFPAFSKENKKSKEKRKREVRHTHYYNSNLIWRTVYTCQIKLLL